MPWELNRNYGPTKDQPKFVADHTTEQVTDGKIILGGFDFYGAGFVAGEVVVQGTNLSLERGRVDERDEDDDVLINRSKKKAVIPQESSVILSVGGGLSSKEIVITYEPGKRI